MRKNPYLEASDDDAKHVEAIHDRLRGRVSTYDIGLVLKTSAEILDEAMSVSPRRDTPVS